jgi:hypothetical protein
MFQTTNQTKSLAIANPRRFFHALKQPQGMFPTTCRHGQVEEGGIRTLHLVLGFFWFWGSLDESPGFEEICVSLCI